jgi:hypothetical protein
VKLWKKERNLKKTQYLSLTANARMALINEMRGRPKSKKLDKIMKLLEKRD